MTSVQVASSDQQQQQAQGYGGPGGYVYPYPEQQYYPGPATNMANQQLAQNTSVVVTNQPAPAPVHVSLLTEKPNPTTFIVTVILMSLCTFFGMIPLLFCFVPALILSVVGFNYGHSKSDELQKQSQTFTRVATGLDIAAMVTFAVTMVIIAISTSAAGAAALRYTGYYYG